MMEGVEEQTSFLNSLVLSKTAKRKTLVLKANKDQVTAIAECILNIEQLDLTAEEKKCIKKYKSVLKRFSNSKFTLLKLKKFVIKHLLFVIKVVATVLTKVIQESVITICNYGSDISSGE